MGSGKPESGVGSDSRTTGRRPLHPRRGTPVPPTFGPAHSAWFTQSYP
jgi:hypothetical protein